MPTLGGARPKGHSLMAERWGWWSRARAAAAASLPVLPGSMQREGHSPNQNLLDVPFKTIGT